MADTTSKASLARFDKAFAKKYVDELKEFDEDKMREDEKFREVVEFVDAVPDVMEDEQDEQPAPKKRTAKARSVWKVRALREANGLVDL